MNLGDYFNTVSELSKKYGYTEKQIGDLLSRTSFDKERALNILETVPVLEANSTVIENIEIVNLFGRETYNFKFRNSMNILLSENGRGKTTIIKIIVSLLRGDFNTLRQLPFERVSMNYKIDNKISNLQFDNSRYIIEKESDNWKAVDNILSRIPYEVRYRLIQNSSIDFRELEKAVQDEISTSSLPRRRYLIERLESLRDELNRDSYNEEVKFTNFSNVIFFPTYRRIEAEKSIFFDSSKIEIDSDDIKFGMDDVNETIDELLQKMQKDANNDYVTMNGEVLSDLLGDKEIVAENLDLEFDEDKFNVVIKRIGEQNINRLDKLKLFIENSSNYQNRNFLYYYLNKLMGIYDSQKILDNKLKNYVTVCSKYLYGKKMKYDEVNLTITIETLEGEQLQLNQLSSGEKQIISIFTKLYLDSTPLSIVIIDEPELSLSMEWQKTLLQDMFDSKNIGLLVATTHSPFIFMDNGLFDYVTDLDDFRS